MDKSSNKAVSKFTKKEKQILILLSIGAFLLVCGIIWQLVWKFGFEKKHIFKQSEERFLAAGKKYYDINSELLPKNGQTGSVTYQTLLDRAFVDPIYVPKTNRTCDLDNSWVRIYNNNGKYEYFKYLKCEKYESDTDHTGPEITLNGDKSIVVALGDKYEEAGVKSVVDDIDGKLDIKNVAIKGSVDTNKTGTYKITYSATDKLLNKTVITREVIVRRRLKDAVIARTDSTNKFKGAYIGNNFVLYSGMLWRIIGLNSDSSIKMVLADNVSNVNYAKDDAGFNKSNIQKWLNEYFYNYLIDPDKYVKKDSTFCISPINNPNVYEECTKYSDPMAVGLLSMQDVKGAEKLVQGKINNFLDGPYYYLLSNLDLSGQAVVKAKAYYTLSFPKTELFPIRPVISLKPDVFIVSGDGTDVSPIRIGDFSSGNQHSKLSDRVTGEVITYSGVNWRIIDHDKDGNTRMVMMSNLLTNNNGFLGAKTVEYKTQNKIKMYNPKEDGNIAETINNEWDVYIKDDLVVSHEYKVPTYEIGQKYTDGKTTKIKTKFSIPNTYEMFSASEDSNAMSKYYLINTPVEEENIVFVNNQNGLAFQLHYLDYRDIGTKIVVYITKDATIAGGSGIVSDPYRIK